LNVGEERQMKRITIEADTETGFFARGKSLARQADQGRRVAQKSVLSFEGPSDMLRLLTHRRLQFLNAVREQPDSITGVAVRLRRGRDSVSRDVRELKRVGIVKRTLIVVPGRGRIRQIRCSAMKIRLEATV
jgi:predicted transcriptional regulator